MTDFDQKGQTVGIQLNADQITIGVSFEQYKADLAEKEKEIRALLVSGGISDNEKVNLESRLNEVHKRRLSEQESYQIHITELKERIARLDTLVSKLPDNIIEEAKYALSNGDTEKAERLFIQIEKQANPHITAAAEAAYQRGKLAEDNINYKEAFEHYHRATLLIPDNTHYLNEAGTISHTLGLFDQAIKYFELALASDLKTYDENHPSVARDRNNLGRAWETLGQTEKAIPYYELALAACKNSLGNAHPTTKTIADNLAKAKT